MERIISSLEEEALLPLYKRGVRQGLCLRGTKIKDELPLKRLNRADFGSALKSLLILINFVSFRIKNYKVALKGLIETEIIGGELFCGRREINPL